MSVECPRCGSLQGERTSASTPIARDKDAMYHAAASGRLKSAHGVLVLAGMQAAKIAATHFELAHAFKCQGCGHTWRKWLPNRR